jgi:hypothetical protein
VGVADLEAALRDAQERLSRAMAALAPKHRGGEMEEFRAARKAALQAERNLAGAKGEEYAVPVVSGLLGYRCALAVPPPK